MLLPPVWGPVSPQPQRRVQQQVLARPAPSPVVFLPARRQVQPGRTLPPPLRRMPPARLRRPWPGWLLPVRRPSRPSRKGRSAVRLPVRLPREHPRRCRLCRALPQAVRSGRGLWPVVLRCRPWGLREPRIRAACRHRGPARRRGPRPIILPRPRPRPRPRLKLKLKLKSRLRPRCGTAIRRHRTPRVQEGSSLPAALRSRFPALTRNSRSSRHRATRRRVAYSVPASRIRGQSSLVCPHRACVVLARRVCRGPAIRGLSIRPASHPSVRQPVVRARHRCLQWGRPLRVPYRPGSSLTWGSAR